LNQQPQPGPGTFAWYIRQTREAPSISSMGVTQLAYWLVRFLGNKVIIVCEEGHKSHGKDTLGLKKGVALNELGIFTQVIKMSDAVIALGHHHELSASYDTKEAGRKELTETSESVRASNRLAVFKEAIRWVMEGVSILIFTGITTLDADLPILDAIEELLGPGGVRHFIVERPGAKQYNGSYVDMSDPIEVERQAIIEKVMNSGRHWDLVLNHTVEELENRGQKIAIQIFDELATKAMTQ
jgi:hypothetical protein